MSNSEQDNRVQAELAKLRQEEDEKALLYKRDPNALQPSKEFIEAHVGKLKSEKELEAEARANAEKQRDAEIREARHREWIVQQSAENQRISEQNRQQYEAEQKDQQKQNLIDRLKQNRENMRNRER